MSKQIIKIAKDFYTAEGGISGYTFWNELERMLVKLDIELSYLDWNELEAILSKVGA